MSLRQWLPFVTLCVLAIVSMMLLYYAITEPLPPEIVSPSPHDKYPYKSQVETNNGNTRSRFPFKKVVQRKGKSKRNKLSRYKTIRESIHNQRAGINPSPPDLDKIVAGFRSNPFNFKRRVNPNKESYKYCNVTDIPSLSALLKAHNKYSSKLTANKIEQLKQLRLKKPAACHSNRTHANHLNKLDMNLDDDNNLVPFINRCNVKGMDLQPDLYEYYGHKRSAIGYLHIFKSGGSTVMETWNNIFNDLAYELHETQRRPPSKVHWRFWQRRLPKELRWLKDKEYFYQHIFNKQFVFSFVRDPLVRFLSSFFEYVVRGNDNVEAQYMEFIHDAVDKYYTEGKKALHLLKELAVIMEHRMKCEYNYRYHYRNANDAMTPYAVNTLGIYWDDHLVPQMHFLLDDHWEAYHLNYVGYAQNIEHSLYNILKEFLVSDWNKFTAERYKKFYYYHARDRHDEQYQTGENKERKSEGFLHKQRMDISDLVLEPNQLSDELTQMICNLYWIDYICLPFDIPPQCNLTELYLQHYGNDVVYRECYQ